jgi:hypothetical protein
VSIRVASEASCTVTVVRPPRKEGLERGEPIKEEPPAEKAESS